MAIKQMVCFNYYPGLVENISGELLDNILSRDSPNDRQRCTPGLYFIYHSDNLLGGK